MRAKLRPTRTYHHVSEVCWAISDGGNELRLPLLRATRPPPPSPCVIPRNVTGCRGRAAPLGFDPEARLIRVQCRTHLCSPRLTSFLVSDELEERNLRRISYLKAREDDRLATPDLQEDDGLVITGKK